MNPTRNENFSQPPVATMDSSFELFSAGHTTRPKNRVPRVARADGAEQHSAASSQAAPSSSCSAASRSFTSISALTAMRRGAGQAGGDAKQPIASKPVGRAVGVLSLEEDEDDEDDCMACSDLRFAPCLACVCLGQAAVLLLAVMDGGVVPLEANAMLGPGTPSLIKLGGLDTQRAVDGEWWRLESSVFVHRGLFQFCANVVLQFYFGKSIERYWSSWHLMLVITLGGAGGNVLSCLRASAATVSVGAGGAVAALVGASVGFIHSSGGHLDQRKRTRMRVITGMLVIFEIVAFFCAASSSQLAQYLASVDTNAHLGGFVTGLLLGFAVAPHHLASDSKSGARAISPQAFSLQALLLLFAVGAWSLTQSVLVAAVSVGVLFGLLAIVSGLHVGVPVAPSYAEPEGKISTDGGGVEKRLDLDKIITV